MFQQVTPDYDRGLLMVLPHVKQDDRYGSPQAYGPEELVPVPLLGDLEIDLSKVMRD